MSSASGTPSHLAQRWALAALIVGALAIAFSPIFVRLSEVGPTATGFYRTMLEALARRGAASVYSYWFDGPCGPEVSRLAAMDLQQIDTAVMFPTSGLGVGRVRDTKFQVALCRAYNDFISDFRL